MANIFDVAKYILEQNGEWMSTSILQKLCYYAQAWALVWSDGTPLFNEDFQAWRNGPVCQELFDVLTDPYTIDADEFKVGSSECLTPNEKDTIKTVFQAYGNLDAHDIMMQTHSEFPWKNARVGLSKDEVRGRIITKDSMGEYYGSL
ncbi:MAG: DUF4065 domain-containing protein [Christensenellaceae bacterium]|jgi:uncharacterized phage-associated protein|nr:DUF4065 domain-containing protein [Christensenellaceae bacterium]